MTRIPRGLKSEDPAQRPLKKLATRDVRMGDPDLKGITAVIVRGNCKKCGKETERKLTELYCHFPKRRAFDKPTATFGLDEPLCDECLYKSFK